MQSVKWTYDVAFYLATTGKEKDKRQPKVKSNWFPPILGVHKINVDAAYSVDSL